MKGMIYRKYGTPDVLEMAELEKPVPRDGEVLIEIKAASLNSFDLHLLKADPWLVRMTQGFFKPRNPRLGADIAGVVLSAGKDVTLFKPGDAIYADISGCGCGGFGEYVCADEKILSLKPANLSFEEAAGVPMAAVTALQGLRDVCHIQPGQKVLIQGASGGVGSFAVQIAKYYGAKVTAVCSTAKVDRVRALGADHVIDYTRVDFTAQSEKYDAILGVNGYHTLTEYKRALVPGGIYAMTGGTTAQIFQAMFRGPWVSLFSDKKIKMVMAHPQKEDLDWLRGLLEQGKIKVPIDKKYPLHQLAEACRYLDQGHVGGKVIITI